MNKTPQRIRLETRIRVLDVVGIRNITPLMRRITVAGDDLEGFSSPGYADHIKVFFSQDAENPILPLLGENGLEFPAGSVRPDMRDYTPRNHDPVARTLDIDFVLHGDGPASSWAAQAKAGQKLVIGGPRGSLVIPNAFDWYLLVGDETALPAIGRRLEELPEAARAVAIIEVANAAEEQQLSSSAKADIVWVHRDGAEAGRNDLLRQAVAAQADRFPTGEAYAFIATESGVSKSIRQFLVEERGFDNEWVKAAGYWLYGQADAHEPH
ncbi:MAG: siderophore-interacting protein [Phyllobacterium sp.]